MIKRSLFFVIIVLIFYILCFAGKYEGKKVLYVNSYHVGYEWSDGIEREIVDTFAGTGIELAIKRMDTKKIKDRTAWETIALEIKEFIEEWKPDVVIASDDNAQEYLVSRYFLGSYLPFVFCGVNSEPVVYGYPNTNVTGMVQVPLIPQLIKIIKNYANGNRLGVLGPETSSFRKFIPFIKNKFQINPNVKMCSTMEEWIIAYKEFQTEVDILIIHTPNVIEGWDEAKAIEIAENETLIPSGCTKESETQYSMIGIIEIPEEQGKWAAETAMKILGGESPENIPITQNKNADIYLNMKIADKLGIVFKTTMFNNATIIK